MVGAPGPNPWKPSIHLDPGSFMAVAPSVHEKTVINEAAGWWLSFNPSEKYARQIGFNFSPVFGVKIKNV